jgi:hypothetical protein
MIKIRGWHFWSHWTDLVTVEVDETKICGFELHQRNDSWHVVVVTKEKSNSECNPYHTYDIEHQVPFEEVVKLLQNPDAKILKILNYYSSDSFIPELMKLFKTCLEFPVSTDNNRKV